MERDETMREDQINLIINEFKVEGFSIKSWTFISLIVISLSLSLFGIYLVISFIALLFIVHPSLYKKLRLHKVSIIALCLPIGKSQRTAQDQAVNHLSVSIEPPRRLVNWCLRRDFVNFRPFVLTKVASKSGHKILFHLKKSPYVFEFLFKSYRRIVNAFPTSNFKFQNPLYNRNIRALLIWHYPSFKCFDET